MHPLIAVLCATAACALAVARAPGKVSVVTADGLPPEEGRAMVGSLREALGSYLLQRYLRVPRYLELDHGHRLPDYDNWLSREIDRLNFMDADDQLESNYQAVEGPDEPPPEGPLYQAVQDRLVTFKRNQLEEPTVERATNQDARAVSYPPTNLTQEEKKKQFALTPLDKGYYDDAGDAGPSHSMQSLPMPHPIHRRDPSELEVPRRTRQNPNLSKNKNLVADNLDKLRAGVAAKDFRVPISLLPTNLHILKISHDDDDERVMESSFEDGGPGHSGFKIEGTPAADTSESFYGIAVIAAAGAALTVTALVFAFGWYTISKKAKAAADVDYPAYGVTGPAVDVSGDRKLAHSAHMYHYQHQKQQILAMERNGVEHRDGSVSDPESEEENEEGDYTVYECPGFATTGDMEVKNPMFSEEPTPATPGKCELVKPQPKE